MRACPSCRWFGKYDELVIDEDGEILVGADAEAGQVFELGDCGRPEGPLDPRTVRPMILSHPSIEGNITGSEGMPVVAGCGRVSSGMACKAFEERAVTEVTAKPSETPDLWGN